MGPNMLYQFIKSEPKIAYDLEVKRQFKNYGHRFLSDVAQHFRNEGAHAIRINYNPGGVAVSGDHCLMVMRTKGEGFALYISEPTVYNLPWTMARRITSLDDHCGGENVWIDNVRMETAKKLSEYLSERFRTRGGTHERDGRDRQTGGSDRASLGL